MVKCQAISLDKFEIHRLTTVVKSSLLNRPVVVLV